VPVKSPPRERPLIEMFLSAYDSDSWKDASRDWVEERQDSAVEVVVTKPDGTRLALEHTIVQPFVGEKFDSEKFMKAFGRIEKSPDLTLPERNLDVIIPVGALPVGYDWEQIGEELLTWLNANHASAPEGHSKYTVPVGLSSKSGPLPLSVGLQVTSLPGTAGSCLIARDQMPMTLAATVERALETKIPKLIKTQADKRILLFERDQMAPGDNQIYDEVVKLAPAFPDLEKIDEIWFVNTSIYQTEGWAYFALIDGRGVVERIGFQNGILQSRRDHRSELGPGKRGF
jgi:hypothetical protein